MHLVEDTTRLARLLQKVGAIDESCYKDIITSKKREDKKERQNRNSDEQRGVNRRNRSYACSALRFIARLEIKKNGDDKILGEDEIIRIIAKKFKLPVQKLDPLKLDLEIATRTLPKPFALKHLVLPLYEKEGRVHVAIADPENSDALEGIAHVTKKPVHPILATPAEIEKIIHEFFGFKSSVLEAELQSDRMKIDLGNLEQLNRVKSSDQIETNDEHIKNAVDYMFNYAFEMRASDIHIEPKRENCIVRFRIDGGLNDVYHIPRGVWRPIASRVKMLARMNIAETRRPQDGRIKIEYEKGTAEMRVSSMPTAFGEKLVIRLLRPEMLLRDLDLLGFFPEDQIKLEKFLNKPHGIILVTGPTGSGKTTTLYSAMNLLASPEINIVSVEDPIETVVDSFNQVAVQPAIGMTFASSLRTILRQDPDIIMIGEIRDRETAENAVQAALTGHLVLSTLHTNDTVSSISRLVDLGVEPYLINASLIGVIAQRLVRLVCPHCAVDVKYSKKRLAQFGIESDKDSVMLKEGRGCEECRFTGYYDRSSVFEILEIDDELREMIAAGEEIAPMREYALGKGMVGLRDNAARKVLGGQTTLDEMLRLGYRL
jgi:general secretion pathway protein E